MILLAPAILSIDKVSGVTRSRPVIGVALDSIGPHPTARELIDIALAAERANIDFVSLDDRLDPPPTSTPYVHLAVQLDALLTLAHVAAATSTIGLIPTVTVTHTEPFHVSKNIATLDLVSAGRGGWQVAVSTTADGAARFGRRPVAPRDELFAEADEVVEVVRRLWDSWEDDAVIRDSATGRYIDRDKVHYVDFEGRFFSVRGPSITPRSPQGQPLVAVRADDAVSNEFTARRADLIFVEGPNIEGPNTAGIDIATLKARRASLRSLVEAAGRDPDEVFVLASVVVGETASSETSAALAGLFEGGAVDGFLLQPTSLASGWEAAIDGVCAAFGESALPQHVPGTTLRQRLGLAKPANRYAQIRDTV